MKTANTARMTSQALVNPAAFAGSWERFARRTRSRRSMSGDAGGCFGRGRDAPAAIHPHV